MKKTCIRKKGILHFTFTGTKTSLLSPPAAYFLCCQGIAGKKQGHINNIIAQNTDIRRKLAAIKVFAKAGLNNVTLAIFYRTFVPG